MRKFLVLLFSMLSLIGGSVVAASPASAAASGCYGDNASPNGYFGRCAYGPGVMVIHLECSRPGYANKTGTQNVYIANTGGSGSYYCPSTAWSRVHGYITWQ